MQTQTTTLHDLFLCSVSAVPFCFPTSTCCKKQDLSFVFLKNNPVVQEKKPNKNTTCRFTPQKGMNLPKGCHPVLCRVLFPALMPAKGFDPHSHQLSPLPCSKVEVEFDKCKTHQFLSLASIRNLPDEEQINHQLSPPTSRILINTDLNTYNLITFC